MAKEFVNETATSEGTPINRETMMALQGFQTNTYTFGENGEIIEQNEYEEILTTRFDEKTDVITETFVGRFTITKTTTFEDGIIREVIS